MSLPVVDTPGKHTLRIMRGDTFGPRRFRWREYTGGPGVQLYAPATISARATVKKPDTEGTVVVEVSTAGGGFTIEDPEIVAPIAISSPLVAGDGVVIATGAKFVEKGVQKGDRVILAGTPSDDTTQARVVSVDSEDQITTDQEFVGGAGGTVSVAHDGWYSITIPGGTAAGQTGSFDFEEAVWDCEFTDAGVSPADVRTPLAGPVILRRDSSS